MLPARAYVVSLASLLAGATAVHSAFGPTDLTIPRYGAAPATARATAQTQKRAK